MVRGGRTIKRVSVKMHHHEGLRIVRGGPVQRLHCPSKDKLESLRPCSQGKHVRLVAEDCQGA